MRIPLDDVNQAAREPLSLSAKLALARVRKGKVTLEQALAALDLDDALAVGQVIIEAMENDYVRAVEWIAKARADVEAAETKTAALLRAIEDARSVRNTLEAFC